MSDLREAAEMALEALEEFCEMETMLSPIERRDALRQALEQPKREWVGLTAEDVFSLVPRGDAWLAGAIEAKLKEKNT